MIVNTKLLLSVASFAKQKGLSRQHVYRLIENNELSFVKIDNILFIILDEKTLHFERKRKSNSSRLEE